MSLDVGFRRLPIVVGITGHRHLRPQDEAALAAAIDEIFARLQSAYPSTPLLLLTPLAEGADWLAADVARQRSIPYRVPLPMPLANYREDFAGPERLARFDELLRGADGPSYEMPFFGTNDAGNIRDATRRADQYALLAAHLGRTAHVLVALWDGSPSPLIGGTAQAVRFRVLGVPKPYRRSQSLIEAPETGPVHQIYTPRGANAELRHPAGFRTLLVRRTQTAGDRRSPECAADMFEQIEAQSADAPDPFETLYGRIDTFNADCARVLKADAPADEESAVRSLCSAAERVATFYQKKFVRAMQNLFAASALAVLLFELYTTVFPGAHALLVLYVAASCFAIWTYVQARRGRWQDRAQDYRALEIGLKVQGVWDAAGLGESVADYYLRHQRSELDWIRDAIRTAHNVDRRLHFDQTRVVETVRAFVLQQYAYFAGTGDDERLAEYSGGSGFPGGAKRERHKANLHERLSMWFLFASFAISGLLITYGLSAWLEPNLLRGLPSEEQWHGGLVFLIAFTAIAAAMFHDYPVRRAHPQHARRYAAMTGMYRRALDALDEAERESPGRTADDRPAVSRIEIARACILELGHEALSENGDWLLLHRELPLELLPIG
jgi:hypothetical protein